MKMKCTFIQLGFLKSLEEEKDGSKEHLQKELPKLTDFKLSEPFPGQRCLCHGSQQLPLSSQTLGPFLRAIPNYELPSSYKARAKDMLFFQ